MGLISLVVFVSLVWRFYSRRYPLACPSWLSWMIELDNPFTHVNRAQVIIESIPLKGGMKVLDAGCGPGRLTIPLAQVVGQQGQVVALDIQKEMLQRVRERAQRVGVNNIQYIKAPLGEGAVGAHQFDYAFLVSVLGEIVDRERALKELFNVLKPGGILLVTEVIFDPHFQTQHSVIKRAQQVGFIEKKRIGSWWAYTLHLQKPGGLQ